jgi:glycosyltransferase involved in cell wall biosynthesis
MDWKYHGNDKLNRSFVRLKILLLTQDINGKGGIGNYFNILQPKLVNVDYLINGTRLDEVGLFSGIRRFFTDYSAFLKMVKQYDLVHINTSLRIKSIVRDSIFILLAKMYRKKTIVFIHGWNHTIARITEKYFLWLYKLVFFKADAFIVLAKEFKEKLTKWGFRKNIYLLTTLVDDDLLKNFGPQQIKDRVIKNGQYHILYLSRIEKDKGIYESLDAFNIVNKELPNSHLLVAGDGTEFEACKKYASGMNIKNIKFLGFVRDDERLTAFQNADLYLFPTNYGEGMPTSILEAMAFGLPVITRAVGGIQDFFENGKMGVLLESNSTTECAKQIKNILVDKKTRIKVGSYNHQFIIDNMSASKVLEKIENIYADFE